MKEKDKGVSLDEKTKEDLKQQFTTLLQDTFISNTGGDNQSDKMEKYELGKIIVNEILGVDRHLPSTTNLTKEQIYSIARANTLNVMFKTPLAKIYIKNVMELKRSETNESKNLLGGLVSALTGNQFPNTQLNTLQRIWGKKGTQ